MPGATDPQFGQARVYRTPGATGEVIASGGTLLVEAGGHIDASAGRITLPGVLRRGFVSLDPLNAQAKTTATASGVVPLSTGTNPQRHSANVDAVGPSRVRWTTAAGATNPLVFPAWRVPFDLATAGGLEIVLVAEGGSGNASNELNVRLFNGTATADLGSTRALTSSPVESTVAITSGNMPATGFVTLVMSPNAHASGAIDLYAVGFSYLRKTS
mgnify:FL=1